ncbi:ATP-binding protein [Aliiglaciecola sp. LCG003]|uniref:ATP-binding protein n=1 Tax=Aliiglaciecola sp. LCG003 TaxID=3053655 RepID=UPI002573BE20|nr:ATP-binding protein [Aliiglaciecola sp. LCG003]WJG10258.1 ATP-binding protein [Aliiglaciecola sp. LCG003]
MTYKIAKYTPSDNPDYKGNPYIESLPLRLNPDDFWERVQDEAYAPEDLSKFSTETLEGMASNIMESVCTTSIYYDVYCDLLGTIKVGYKNRNPLNEDVKKWQQKIATTTYKRTRTTAPSLKFTGYSGLGKTTLVDSVLGLIEPVLIHPSDGPLNEERVQIVYLKVNIPGDSNTKDICLDLFEQIDGILGLKGKDSYHSMYCDKSRSDCIKGLVKICTTLLVGMIIFDEMQNICTAVANEKNLIFKFFDKLTNEAKVPTLKIGTSKANKLTDSEFSNARRLGIPYDWKNYTINDTDWTTLVEYAWSYQLLPEFEPLTVRYKKKIYELTRGIPHCLFFLIEQANVLGLRSGEAKFSLDLLDIVFEKRFSIMKTGIIALRHGNVAAFDDLMSAGQYIDKEVEKLVKKLIKIGDNINLSKAEAKSLYEHVEKYLPEYKPTKAEEKILDKLFKKAELEATDLIEEDGYLRVPM